MARLVWFSHPPTWLTIDDLEEVALRLTLTDSTLDVDAVLGYDADADTWYGPRQALDEVLMDTDAALADVTGFRLDDEPAEVAVQVSLSHEPLSWAEYAEAMDRAQREAEAPPPDPATARERPVTDDAWALGIAPMGWVTEETDEPLLAFVALIVDDQSRIRSSTVTTDVRDTEVLTALVLKATNATPFASAGRPRRLLVSAPDLEAALRTSLAQVQISVAAGGEALLAPVMEAFAEDTQGPNRPGLVHHAPNALAAFFDTARSFFHLRPWTRFDGNKYLAFRIDDGPWRYANVMGQAGEQYGLGFFEDWLQLCRFIHNQPSWFDALSDRVPMLEAAGAVESLTLYAWDELHSRDAAYVQEHALKPLRDGYPVVQRYEPGPRGVEPVLSLADYRALMDALTQVLKRRSTPTLTSITRTLDVDGGRTVELRYPSEGTEAVEPGRTVRLVVEGRSFKKYRSQLDPGQRIEVLAAADTPFHKVLTPIRNIERPGTDPLYLEGLYEEGVQLWSEAMGRRSGPSPALDALVGREGLTLHILTSAYPVHVAYADEDAPPKPRATFLTD